MKIATLVCLLSLLLASPAHAFLFFGPKGDDAQQKRDNIMDQDKEMLAQLYKINPAMKAQIKKAAGYATFKYVNLNLLLLSTANGYGVVVNNKTHKKTYMRMASLGGGIGAGINDVRVVFVFRDAKVMQQFIDQGWEFGGQTGAAAKYKQTGAAATQSVSANVDFQDGAVVGGTSSTASAGNGTQADGATISAPSGMEIYQFTESGISAQATVSGTKYWKDSALNK